MEPILKCIETALASSSPTVRVCVMTFVAIATLWLAIHLGMSLGKALYYFTH